MSKIILLTSIIYNEIDYINEYINFHLKQNIDLIYIQVNYINSINIDLYNSIINTYKDNKQIIFSHIKFYNFSCMKEFIKNYYDKHINDWLITLDIDEFIYSPIEKKSIKDIINIYEEKNIYAVSVNWLCFGSNNLKEKPKSVLEGFTKCSDKYEPINYTTKSLVKINKIDKNLKNINTSHKFPLIDNNKYFTSCGLCVNEYNKKYIEIMKKNRKIYLKNIENINKDNLNYNTFGFGNNTNHRSYPEENPCLIINHYIVRSENEYQIKIDNNPHSKGRYNINHFNKINSITNNIENKLILNFK